MRKPRDVEVFAGNGDVDVCPTILAEYACLLVA
jgi:hypothetical protein